MNQEKKLQVLVVVPTMDVVSGVSAFVMNYYRRIDRTKFDMDFVVCDDSDSPYVEEIRERGDEVFFLPPMKQYKRHKAMCRDILQKKKYDIIHDHTLHVSLPLMLEAKKQGVPVRILHAHATKLGRNLVKEIRNRAFLPVLKSTMNCYASCGEEAGEMMFGDYPFTLIYNPIDTEKYHFKPQRRRQLRNQLGVRNDQKLVLCAGRLHPEKNPIFALHVAKEVVKKDPSYIFMWAGEGNVREELEKEIKRLHMEKSFILLGKRNDVQDLYSAADVFFLPSVYEGLPLVVLEAQATGLPCIMSTGVTTETIFTDLVTLCSLTEDDIDTWSEVMICAGNFTEREDTRDALKKSQFDTDKCVHKLETFYQAHFDLSQNKEKDSGKV